MLCDNLDGMGKEMGRDVQEGGDIYTYVHLWLIQGFHSSSAGKESA